jgi:hypothetical protein
VTTEKAGILEAGVKLGSAVVHSLAPQFLALLLINGVFVGVLFWFVDARARHTATLINQLLAGCLQMRTP